MQLDVYIYFQALNMCSVVVYYKALCGWAVLQNVFTVLSAVTSDDWLCIGVCLQEQ